MENENLNIDDMIEEDLGVSQESSIEILMLLGADQLKKEDELGDLKEQVKEKEDEIKELKNKRIPDMMNTLGSSDFSLKTGERIEIKKLYFGSIKDNEEQYFEYLRKYDLDDIIKNIITITLDKDESFKAIELVENLEKMGYGVDHKKNIHGGTLKSHIKEKLEGLDELKEDYIIKGGIPVKEGEEGWKEYLQFAIDRDQEADLMFPKELCKAFVLEQSKITIPKKSKKRR